MNVEMLRDRLRPTTPQAVDVGFAMVLLLIAIVGFRATFAGNEELYVGVPAVLLGAAVGYVLTKFEVELLPAVAASAVAFVALSAPVAIRSEALFGFLPTPGSLTGLVDGLVSGWIRLLTSVPPAGEAGNLLAIPYLVGFVGGVVTLLLALRLRQSPACALGPLAVLVIAVLFGTRRPVSVLLHGVVFGVIAVAWLAVREARRRTITIGVPARQRLLSGGGLLVGVALVATFLGPMLPGAEANPRFVLREHVDPPFDPLAEPSPLTGYRRYTGPDNEEEPVLEIEGLPAGVPIRLAVLDDFDGLVWRATGEGTAAAGRFSRIGEEIPDTQPGTPAEVTVTVRQPHGVWLPTVGDVVTVDFDTGDERRDDMRFNLETETAAIPTGVAADESYTMSTVVSAIDADLDLAGLPLDSAYSVGSNDDVPNEIIEFAARLRGGAESPYAKVTAIAEQLRTEGTFSDGGPQAAVPTAPGHSLARIGRFLGAPQWVGNGEQYAAALGLMAVAEGIPARVVMGFRPEQRGEVVTVTGADVAAWVEIPLEGAGWVPVSATPPVDQLPDPSVKPRPRPLNPEPQPPPPPDLPPPAELPQDLDAADTEDEVEEDEEDEDDEDDDERADRSPFLIAGGGVATALMLPPGLIIGAKSRRRSRRRRRGGTRDRADGAWAEVADRALDLGQPLPRHATRREASAAIPTASAAALAARADSATFGPTEPDDTTVTAMWSDADTVVSELRSEHGLFDRARAAISLNSLRRRR